MKFSSIQSTVLIDSELLLEKKIYPGILLTMTKHKVRNRFKN